MASFSPDDEVLSLSTTVGSEDEALRLARLLVAQRLAACVQVEAIHRSVYRWEGQVAEEPEWRLTAKTAPALRPALEAALVQHHPYQLSQVLWAVMQGGAAYAAWVREETVGPVGSRG